MMKIVVALCLVIAAAVHGSVIPATTLVRTPSLDSAIIKSDRLGGNFAYSTVEGHAYAAVSPVVQRVFEPVGVSYTAHQVPLGYAAAPIAVSQPLVHTVVAHQPFLAHQQILSQPILGQHLLAPSAVVSSPIIAQAPVAVQGQQPAAPVVAQADPAPASAPSGAVLDDDSVSVESA